MEKEELNRHREAESQARGGAGDSGGVWWYLGTSLDFNDVLCKNVSNRQKSGAGCSNIKNWFTRDLRPSHVEGVCAP